MQQPGTLSNPNPKIKTLTLKKLLIFSEKNYTLKISYILESSLIQPSTTTLCSLHSHTLLLTSPPPQKKKTKKPNALSNPKHKNNKKYSKKFPIWKFLMDANQA